MNKKQSTNGFWTKWKGWFTVGIGVKRWLVVLAVGAVIAGTGISALLIAFRRWGSAASDIYGVVTVQFLPTGLRIILPLLIGFLIMLLAIVRLSSNLVAPYRRPDEDVPSSLYRYSQRGRGPKVVAIGGGTGLPNLLRGLVDYTSNISAIITVADDGGSSGRIRRELGMIPPGDFRNNIAALARDEELMTQLLQYRFGRRLGEEAGEGDAGELQGHAFGNLLLAALTGVTGSFDEGLAAAGRVLAIQGQVLPSTLSNVILEADIRDEGERTTRRVTGESFIPQAGGQIERIYLQPADPPAFPGAVQAILQADLIVIGPGSLYTSILPNLLVPGISQALRSTTARRVFVCNLATQPGETDNYVVADHLKAVDRHLARLSSKERDWVDLVIANDNLSIPTDQGGGRTTYVRPEGLPDVPLATFDLVDEMRPWRHDSSKLAQAIASIAL